jgi:hypothetical protein
VTLDMVEAHSEQTLALPVNVVDVCEIGTTPRGEKPLHWRLLTNAAVGTMKEVLAARHYALAGFQLHRAHARLPVVTSILGDEKMARLLADVIDSTDPD